MKASCAALSASVRREIRVRGRSIAGCRDALTGHARPGGGPHREVEADLPAADQLDIDLGQDLGVEERAVLGAPGIVDAIARAERIEIVRRTRMLAPGHAERVDRIGRG